MIVVLLGRVLGKVMDWLMVGFMNMVPLFSMGKVGVMSAVAVVHGQGACEVHGSKYMIIN